MLVMENMHDDNDGLSLFLRPSVADLRKGYEEMVTKLNSGVFAWTKRPKRGSMRLKHPINFAELSRATGLQLYEQQKLVVTEHAEAINLQIVPLSDLAIDQPIYSKQDNPISSTSPPPIPTPPPMPVPTIAPTTPTISSTDLEVTSPTPTSPTVTVDEYPEPTVIHISTVEDFIALFNGCEEPGNNIYHIDLGNNAMGNQAFLELTEAISRDMVRPLTLTVVSLDLSWNDLEEESVLPFSQVVLEKLTGLSSVKLDGNPIGAQGLEAILHAVVASKSATIPIELSLRETSIGDDGVSSLAAYLKEDQLPISVLDLTNSCIFDATTALALGLGNNTSLHTLVMDDNMIGNQGAFALGEALLVNEHLRTLQIRNCDIGAAGITRLCDGIRSHPSLKIIDVGLNPWEFAGELQLLELTWSLPRSDLSVKWREAGWDYGEEELVTLVNHFSVEAVLDRVLAEEGEAFQPLITNAQLLGSSLMSELGPLHIASRLSYQFQDSSDIDNFDFVAFIHKSLDVITQLADIHMESPDSWSRAIELLLPLLDLWLNPEQTLSGVIHLKIVQLFTALVRHGSAVINKAIQKSIGECVELFFLFPKRNIYHQQVISLVEAVMYTLELSGESNLQEYVCGQFAPRIMALITENGHTDAGYRSTLYGHAMAIAPILGPFLDAQIWGPFEQEYVLPLKAMSGQLAGPPPSVPKRSQRTMVEP